MTIPQAAHTRRRNDAVLRAALAVAAAVTLAACNDSSNAAPLPPVTTSPTPTAAQTPDARAVASQQALAAYRGYYTLSDNADRKPVPWLKELGKYARGTFLSEVQLNVREAHYRKETGRGAIGHAPQVTHVQLMRKHPLVQIRDCYDVSQLQLIDAGGKVLKLVDPKGRPLKRRFPLDVKVEKWGGSWYVVDSVPRQDQVC